MALKSGRVGIHPSQVDPITGMLLSSPGGASDLSDLDDVSIDNPESGQLLIYDGDKWENQFASISPTTLASLQDVSIDNPEEGQQLVYNGDSWENQFASISPLSLAQLRDVEITDLQDGDFITYDSTSEKWVNTGEAPTPTVIQQEITIYSAVEDVISYIDIYGATQTEAFAANSDHKTITVDIYESGSNITFISSVAKNPSNLSSSYVKTVTITSATTDIYVMPDNALYWWGYNRMADAVQAGFTVSGYSYQAAVFNKNSITIDANANSKWSAAAYNEKIAVSTVHAIAKSIRVTSSEGLQVGLNIDKQFSSNVGNIKFNTQNTEYRTATSSSPSTEIYISAIGINTNGGDLYALWYE